VRAAARSAAARRFAETIEEFERAGYRVVEHGDFVRRLEAPGALPLAVTMTATGRVFGGSVALEIATADPVLPPTRGLRGRGRGAVRLSRVAFLPRRGDPSGARLAERLEENAELQRALASVHFERIRVESDGRPVVRHMGGSVVWVLFPPVVRAVPLTAEQVVATVAALEAFAGGR
jgi:hypothetical protein